MSEDIQDQEVNDVDSEVPDGQVNDTQDHSSEEADASKMGWVPKDEFRGDPGKWSDAATFLERGRQLTPILRENNKRLLSRIDQLEREHRDTADMARKYYEQSLAKKDEEISGSIAEQKRLRNQAIREGEDDLAENIESNIEKLNIERQGLKNEAPKQRDDSAKANADLQDWISDGNEWFGKDDKLNKVFDRYARSVRSEDPDLKKWVGRAFLDKVETEVRKDFPDMFENPNRSRAGTVERGSAPAGKKGRTSRDLPESDRKAMERMVKAGFVNEEQFLSEYNW